MAYLGNDFVLVFFLDAPLQRLPTSIFHQNNTYKYQRYLTFNNFLLF